MVFVLGYDMTPEEITADIIEVRKRLKEDEGEVPDLLLFEIVGQPVSVKNRGEVKPVPIELKAEKKEITEIEYHDFEEFVNSIYGGNFEIVPTEELDNYSNYKTDVPNVSMDFNGEVEAKIRQGIYPMYCTHILFNVLHKDGHIKEGEYLIKVSW